MASDAFTPKALQRPLLLCCLVLLHLTAIAKAAPEDFNCAEGCPKAAPQPVCGSDQRTYGSACFAYCQGVTSYTEGACDWGRKLVGAMATEEDLARAAAQGGPTAASPVVTVEAMTRFKNEGFNFIGIGRTGPQFRVREDITTYRKNGKPYNRASSVTTNPRAPLTLIRLVADGSGYLYESGPIGTDMDAPNITGGRFTAPGFDPEAAAAGAAVALVPSNVDAEMNADDAASELGVAVVAAAGNRRLKIVMGTDDRVEVGDTTAYPWRTIGQLMSPQSGALCTAAVISQTFVLSAAHCAYDRKTSTWAGRYEFRAGRDGTYVPYGRYTTSSNYYNVFSKYIDGDPTYDISIIQLPRTLKNLYIGDRVGWMGRSWGDAAHSGIENTAGYPGDKGGDTMWHSSCTVAKDAVTDRVVKYSCDTEGGQSGSPVWIYKTAANTRHIVGVHRGWSCKCCVSNSPCTRGTGSDGCCTGSITNRYTPLTQSIGNTIKKLVA